ncbi:MAG: ABC transporter permease [Candidatus Sungbacteria bacterium]|nr:ABC transporter permease [Candidatus Sungbacteria bacterium]
MKEALTRIGKTALLSFWRNGLLSTATVLVMVLTLFVIGGLLLSSVLMNTVLDSLQEKIDVSVYFLPDTPEELILKSKADFETIPFVSSIAYISQAEALERFKEKHKDNPLISESLKELAQNPLEASLNITATDPSKFREIVSAIESRQEKSIDKINYHENQKVIERLSRIMAAARTGGATLAAVLAFIAVLVAFNTVRLAIYTAREEIQIMRLVGATAWYIRGPFLLEGMMDGALAAAITTVIFIPLTWLVSPKLLLLVEGTDLFSYFLSNFFEFFFILLFVGVALGVLSSMLAIRRYLKI